MSSVFSQKVEAVRDKIPESVLETPWKRTLLLVVFLIGAIAATLFFAIFGLLKVIFEKGGNLKEDDRFNFNPAENDIDEFGQTAAERLNNSNILFETMERTDDFGTVQDGDW